MEKCMSRVNSVGDINHEVWTDYQRHSRRLDRAWGLWYHLAPTMPRAVNESLIQTNAPNLHYGST
jgi:hypothetical protein